MADMSKKQNTKVIDEWKKEHTDLVRLRPRKEERIIERVQMAVEKGCGKSRQAHMLEAIKKALENDGIPELKDE